MLAASHLMLADHYLSVCYYSFLSCKVHWSFVHKPVAFVHVSEVITVYNTCSHFRDASLKLYLELTRVITLHTEFDQHLEAPVLMPSVTLLQDWIIGPILWGHSGPLCHALSLLLSLWISIRTGSMRQLAVANGPNIFQMLLVD